MAKKTVCQKKSLHTVRQIPYVRRARTVVPYVVKSYVFVLHTYEIWDLHGIAVVATFLPVPRYQNQKVNSANKHWGLLIYYVFSTVGVANPELYAAYICQNGSGGGEGRFGFLFITSSMRMFVLFVKGEIRLIVRFRVATILKAIYRFISSL